MSGALLIKRIKLMPDYEDLILARQEELELWEDDPSSWEVYYGKYNATAEGGYQAPGKSC